MDRLWVPTIKINLKYTNPWFLNVDENIIITGPQIKHINNEKVKDFYEMSLI